MTDKNYHADGFVPMQIELFDDFKAMPKGSASDDIAAQRLYMVNKDGYVKPLTEEEVSYFTHQMILCCGQHPAAADINILGLIDIVRAVERAHGIV